MPEYVEREFRRYLDCGILVDHTDHNLGLALLMASIGTTDTDFLSGLTRQLANASTKGAKADDDALNFMLSIIKGVQPQDQVETLLAAQMAVVHDATMTFARRLNHVENIPQQDSAANAFNKLARTFAAQVEALSTRRHSRHTTAMHLLQSGVPFSDIALWLGHESVNTTHRYVEANLEMKEKALARLDEPKTTMRRYRPANELLKFLQQLQLCKAHAGSTQAGRASAA